MITIMDLLTETQRKEIELAKVELDLELSQVDIYIDGEKKSTHMPLCDAITVYFRPWHVTRMMAGLISKGDQTVEIKYDHGPAQVRFELKTLVFSNERLNLLCDLIKPV